MKVICQVNHKVMHIFTRELRRVSGIVSLNRYIEFIVGGSLKGGCVCCDLNEAEDMVLLIEQYYHSAEYTLE